MKPSFSWLSQAIRCGALVVLVSMVPAAGLSLQQQEPRKKDDRIAGKIQKLDRESKTISLQLRSKLVRTLVYTTETTFSYRNKTATLDDVKNGRTLTCLGAFDEKTQFAARSCIVQ